jgi:hypothetical protein
MRAAPAQMMRIAGTNGRVVSAGLVSHHSGVAFACGMRARVDVFFFLGDFFFLAFFAFFALAI